LTGESFDAARAAELGLISLAVPRDQLDNEVDHYIDLLMQGAPQALAGVKAMLRRERHASFAADLAELGELSATYFGSAEAKEGMAAFREKRPAAWVSVE
jgi:methylglutaconyl-CoA hydratase